MWPTRGSNAPLARNTYFYGASFAVPSYTNGCRRYTYCCSDHFMLWARFPSANSRNRSRRVHTKVGRNYNLSHINTGSRIDMSLTAYLALLSHDSTPFIFYRCVFCCGFMVIADRWRKVLYWSTYRNLSGNYYIHSIWMARSWCIRYDIIWISALCIGTTGTSLQAVHVVWIRRWI